MKSKHFIFIIAIIFILLGLSACAGAANTASSWPGLTVDDQFAYLAYQTQVYAINLDNGREEWHFPGEPDNSVNFFADPSLSEDGQLIVGGYDGVLYSLEADTGRMTGGNWPFSEAEGRYIASALVVEDNIYAPAADDNLYALDLNGSRQWIFPSDGESWAQPAVDSDCECLYLSSMEHSVYAIDPVNGSEIWQSPQLDGSVVGTPAISEAGVLYVGTFGGKLFALDARDGSILWEFPTEANPESLLGLIEYADNGWIWSGPALSNGVLYFGDLNGYFYAVDANDGTQIWLKTPDQLGLDDGEIVGTPLVIEENIYVATNEGSLFKINTSGDIIDEVNVDPDGDGKIYTSPKTSNGLILVAPIQIDEMLIAYDQDLNKQWSFKPGE
jgi:outer membrane protein assembly factor BamB